MEKNKPSINNSLGGGVRRGRRWLVSKNFHLWWLWKSLGMSWQEETDNTYKLTSGMVSNDDRGHEEGETV